MAKPKTREVWPDAETDLFVDQYILNKVVVCCVSLCKFDFKIQYYVFVLGCY